MVDNISQCRTRALNLLARREHSQQELYRKLLAKGFAEPIVATVLEQLANKNFLSDTRFAELYIKQRAERGYGPLRIQQELQQRGVNTEIIDQAFALTEADWHANAHQAWKKYMRLHPDAEYVQQQKFLLYRGFSYDQIKTIAISTKTEMQEL